MFAYAALSVKRLDRRVRGVGMLLTVPYSKQKTDWSCAVACAEMVAAFYGRTVLQEEMYKRLKKPVTNHPGQWCVYNNDLISEMNKLGFEASTVIVDFMNPDEMMKTVRHFIDDLKGPLIATQRTAMTSPLGHSRLIVGYEDPTSEDGNTYVRLHDPGATFRKGVPPGGENRKWKAQVFADMWRPNDLTAGGQAIWIGKLIR